MPTGGSPAWTVLQPAVNITEQIANHLADRIIQDKLAGGARIQELKIARELGVSRGSVREALLLLERRHLIEIVPRRGAVVNEIVAEEAVELIEALVDSERRLLHKIVACPQACSGLLEAAPAAVKAMEIAARDDDVACSLAGRLAFYAALLQGVSRYTRAVFDCLLPSSQRVLWYLLEHSNLDLHDIARFYGALHTAVAEGDQARVDELLTGYQHRLGRLTCEAYGGRDLTRTRTLGNGASSPATAGPA